MSDGLPGDEYTEQTQGRAASELNELLDAVRAIRAADCGAWLKDCTSGLNRCSDGREKRYELMRLLDNLYKTAGI